MNKEQADMIEKEAELRYPEIVGIPIHTAERAAYIAGRTASIDENDLMKKIEFWTKRYEFSFQFWGEGQNNVYVNKDFVEVASFGGYKTIEGVMKKVIEWCEKSNPRIKYNQP